MIKEHDSSLQRETPKETRKSIPSKLFILLVVLPVVLGFIYCLYVFFTSDAAKGDRRMISLWIENLIS